MSGSEHRLLQSETAEHTTEVGVVTLLEMWPREADTALFRPCTHGFSRGHCLAAMGSNLCTGAVGPRWDEEVWVCCNSLPAL